jgi:hypothetical protein
MQSMQSLPTLMGSTSDSFFAPHGAGPGSARSPRTGLPTDFAASATSFVKSELEDAKSFNNVSGRSYALSGRDVRFRTGEALRIMQRSTRASKTPTG